MEEEERSVAETTLWGLDNLFHCHIKLSARDVGSLKRYREDVSQVALLPPAMRPVRFLQLIGRIVGLSRSGRVSERIGRGEWRVDRTGRKRQPKTRKKAPCECFTPLSFCVVDSRELIVEPFASFSHPFPLSPLWTHGVES